jgi:hypothetical protein
MTDPAGELQALIDRSVRTAGRSVADSLAYPERQMTAAELVAFVREARLIAMATVGPGGAPHVAPVHAELDGTRLRVVTHDLREAIRVGPRTGAASVPGGT